MADPFFSVIITTYNRPHQILRALESVIEQEFKSFEVIIVNDGSTVSYDLLLGQINGISNIKYFHKKNEERSVARNFGVENAEGKFICFLDDDDYYLPNHLQVLYDKIAEENYLNGIYHTYSKIFTKDNRIILEDISPHNKKLTTQEFYVTTGVITMNSYCVSRNILIEYPYDSALVFAEDHNQRLRAMSKYPVFAVNEYTNIYDKSNETSTSSGNVNVLQAYIYSWKYNFKTPEIKSKIRRKIRNRILYKYFHLLLNYHRHDLSIKSIFEISLNMVFCKPKFKTCKIVFNSLRWKMQGR